MSANVGDGAGSIPKPRIKLNAPPSTGNTRARSDLAKRPRRNLSSKALDIASISTGAPAWAPPAAFEDGFRTRIGASIIEEFVAGHTANDVLRELVQNEFDAGGETMSVVFGQSELLISGSGRPIDRKGWDRLDVVIGTGRVAGDDSHPTIEAKQNGIGSKNFGLRSLFLFGNRIFVRSAGRMAVLDLPKLGTQIVRDPASRGQRGVHIHVPYREAAFQNLGPFTPEREADAFEKMADGLLATLVKLALTGSTSGIRRLTLKSERSQRTLSWTQDAKAVQCKLSGITVLRRVGRLVDGTAVQSKSNTTSFDEIEFSRAVAIPPQFLAQIFPRYYRAGENALRVSVSLPIRRGRIDFSAIGRFYYPLQAPSSATESVLSVSAPFELVAERSALLASDWNTWLTEQAADLVKTLLTKDWTRRFGPDAYLAVRSVSSANPDTFTKSLDVHLRTAECWPTADDGQFAKANDLIVPERPEFHGLLSPNRYLTPAFAKVEAITGLVQVCGAKLFTRNSLIRLRCAGKDDSHLATKISAEANLYYTDYDRELRKPERQIAMGHALAAVGRHLSPLNRQDLKATASTLAADGGLRAAKDLVVVSDELWDVCPAPLATRLHRTLINEKALVDLCEPFDLDVWVQDAAQRAAAGTIDEDERQALYDHLLSEDLKLSRPALTAIRRSPVVRNQRNEWVAPNAMVMLPRALSGLLDKAIHIPPAELAKNTKLIASLRIRDTLTGSDLVTFAARLAEEPEKAEAFEALLKANSKPLSRKTVAALKLLPFLRTRSGILAAPADLHVDNPVNRICAGSGDRVVAGHNLTLYKRLGCRERPSSSIMLQSLAEARDQNRPLTNPEVFYPTLVLALKAEKQLVNGHATLPILKIGEAYHAPQDVLIGPHVPSCFVTTVPHLRGPATIVDAYAALGAYSQPQDRHWVQFFNWGHDRYEADEVVPAPVCKMLREAYQRRGYAGLPPDLPNTTRCLLGRDHKLYSLQDLRDGRLVEDDFPLLSAALTKAGASVGFADLSEGNRSFFQALRLKRLTSIAAAPRMSVGAESKPPAWFQPRHVEQILTLIGREDFRRAIDLLAYAHQRESEGFRAISRDELSRRLLAIERIAFVTGVDRIYTLSGKTVTVTTEAGALADRIALRPMRTKFEFEQSLTYALAELVGAVKVTDARRLSVAILPLLMCETSADISAYLERQGLRPNDWVELDTPAIQPTTDIEVQRSPEEEVLRQMVDNMFARARAGGPRDTSGADRTSGSPPPNPGTPTPPPSTPSDFEFPPLDSIHPTVIQPSDHAVVADPPSSWTGSGGGSGGSGAWTPPNWHDIERDRKVGERGEEIVYRAEIERVRQLGYAVPEQHVVWVSKSDPGADHDIRSIDDDGKPIWIEVKSTMGTDGRFEWPQREFEKALREGKRYVLWRVYEAHTDHPTAKPFRDPAGLLARSALRVEISGLRGVVEPKSGY